MEGEEYREIFERLQTDATYVVRVREVRGERKLHPFVEHRLQDLVGKIPGAAHLHAQPEKNGISNGRIDLAVYGEGRAVVHCELIASTSGGHVFRDTTSLLGSLADSRLAILIDEDVDPDVAQTYFRAIPTGEVPHAFLRTLVLTRDEDAAIALLTDQLNTAAFEHGSFAVDGFRCSTTSREVKPGDAITVNYANLAAPTRFRARLMSPSEDPLVLEDTEVHASSGTTTFRIPRGAYLSRGRYLLQFTGGQGQRCSRPVYVTTSSPRPRLVIVGERRRKPGDRLRLQAFGFPANSRDTLTFWEGGGGQGVAELCTDDNGNGEAEFDVPRIMNRRFISGPHRISFRVDAAEAADYVDIAPLDRPDAWQKLPGQRQSNDGVISLNLSSIEYRPEEIRLTGSVLAQADGVAAFHVQAELLGVDGKTWMSFSGRPPRTLAGEALPANVVTNFGDELRPSNDNPLRLVEPTIQRLPLSEPGRLMIRLWYRHDSHHRVLSMDIHLSQDETTYLTSIDAGR